MKPTYWDVIELCNTEKINYKTACKKLQLDYKGFYYFKKKEGLPCAKRGHDKNSHSTERKFNVNDFYFSKENLTLESCYWAGFIAADGNIAQNNKVLNIYLQHTDKCHLLTFKEDISYEGTIKEYVSYKDLQKTGIKKVYYYDAICLTSSQIAKDLREVFNIVPAKSKILKFPYLPNQQFTDAFIKGYIDGDGSIGVNLKNNDCYISLACGSINFIENIAKRFSEIINTEKVQIYNKDNTSVNTINLRNKKARIIISHFAKISTPCLERKWGKAIEHVNNFVKKHRNDFKLKIIIDYLDKGMNMHDIAREMQMTYQAVSYYLNKPYYKQLLMKIRESAELDKGEIDMETQESINNETVTES